MKKYQIQSIHTVFIDNYENGEGNQVNLYSLNKIIKAETPKEAIIEYIKDFLYYDISPEHLEKDEEKPNVIHTGALVDEDNSQATERQIEDWKKGLINLYSNNIYIVIEELKEIEIEL